MSLTENTVRIEGARSNSWNPRYGNDLQDCLKALPQQTRAVTAQTLATSALRILQAAIGQWAVGMKLMVGLLLLLAGCVVVGAIRKLGGGTFLPPPGSDGDHHVRDRSRKWWWYNADDGNLEEALRKKKR
jgi:hypothetical protein